MATVYVLRQGQGKYQRNVLATIDLEKAATLYVEFVKNDKLDDETDNPYLEVWVNDKRIETFNHHVTDAHKVIEILSEDIGN